jgi:hypothetical protein
MDNKKSVYKECNARKYNLRKCRADELDSVKGCIREHWMESFFIIR